MNKMMEQAIERLEDILKELRYLRLNELTLEPKIFSDRFSMVINDLANLMTIAKNSDLFTDHAEQQRDNPLD